MRSTHSALALVLLLLGLGSAGCRTESRPAARPVHTADATLKRVGDDFLAGRFAFRPLDGVAVGWHQYDGRFTVPDRETLTAELARLKQTEAELRAIDAAQLSPARCFDRQLLGLAVANARWALEWQRAPWRNPMYYVGALDVSIYLKRNFKPLPERVRDMTAILQRAPELYRVAREQLEPVLPLPFVQTAIETATGTAGFLEKDVAAVAAGVTEERVRADFDAANRLAVAETRSFVEWLRRTRLPRADGAFAVGREGYQAMLRSELIELTPEEILAVGMRELRAEQERFATAAAEIDPGRKPIEVFRAMQAEHPTAANLLPQTRRNLEAIRQFLIDRRIVTLPSDVRALVAETLPPFRATSFASMDTPGPFETRATEAYYYVTPVEPDWTPQQAEEWLTAFNDYAVDVTSIHEAYPGHYTQFLALNASRASTIAKVTDSYPFIEGWAHYTEQMMIEQGFGQPATPAAATPAERVRAAKYRLEQSDEALLRLCRLCCSIQLHCQGMTVDQATRFFRENCYFEEKPARAEATRGTFDPGYLYYTLGKLMILKLRRDWQAQEGAEFTLQRFHDELLRHGTPALPLLRQVMLKNPRQWPNVL